MQTVLNASNSSCKIGGSRGTVVSSRIIAKVKPQRPQASSNGATTTDVDFDELSDIIRLVNETDIVELSLKSKRFNLEVRKQEALKTADPIYQVVNAPPSGYSAPQQAPQAVAPALASAAAVPPVAALVASAPVAAASGPIDGIEIGSPMSGTFYAAAAPGEPNFVKLGDRVKKGQTVGIIEAMKLMNEIEAEVSGEVVKLMVENGKPVTPGQPLMIIRP
jgi:acetyl-CoA carboxylase biotin carboxyl carrier protein